MEQAATLNQQSADACSACGCELAPKALTCPQCHRLVHGERLRQLSTEAEQAASSGETVRALTLWREALELLPPQSRQYKLIADKCAELSRHVPASDETPRGAAPRGFTGWGKAGAAAGSLALLIWKFKFVFALLLSKGKFLLLGLSKGSTFLSMFLSFGVYWTAWGWQFALGLVGSIYIHEMGHVAALRRFGIKASAPMFIPGFGAMIRMKQAPTSAREDARVGLAGPIWGLGAALAAYAVFLVTGAAIWAAIAKFGAWVNLFNLLPVWQLDGSRGFRALNRGQRWFLVSAVGVAWFVSAEGLLLLIGVIALLRLRGEAPDKPDQVALGQFVFLIVALTALAALPVPPPGAESAAAAATLP
jgi:Zn-dependent protease